MSGLVVTKNTVLPVKNSLWQLLRSDGQFIDLPVNYFRVEDSGLKYRWKIIDRMRSDGGAVSGDGSFDMRQFTLEYQTHATDDATFRNTINEIVGFFDRDRAPYYIVDRVNAIRMEVRPKDNKVRSGDGMRNRQSRCTMRLQAVDALWSSVDVHGFPGGTGSPTGGGTTGGGTGTGAGWGVIIANEGTVTLNNASNYDCYPTFYITAQDNVITFSLENTTLNGGFTISTNDFTAGRELIVNNDAGTITLDGVEKSASISQGGFIRLRSGDNIIRYESDNGDIEFEATWRLRYGY